MKEPILLFDVMGTLVHDPFYREMPAFFGVSLERLIAEKDPTAWIEYERGELDEQTFLARFFADGRDYDRRGMVAAMRAAYRFIDGMEELLGELERAGYAMHALSNYSDWYEMIEDELRLARFLSWSFVSCETGLRKPEPEAYLSAAESLGVEPGRCLFIDDREENCEAARALGMPAIRFESAERLRADLTEHGITHP